MYGKLGAFGLGFVALAGIIGQVGLYILAASLLAMGVILLFGAVAHWIMDNFPDGE